MVWYSFFMSATYSVKHYENISRVEDTHFWFRARNVLLEQVIRRFVECTSDNSRDGKPSRKRAHFLEVGCGTGIVIKTLERLGFAVTGLDVNAKAIEYARKGSVSSFIRQSFHSYTPGKTYDCVGMFDVLEHQQDDLGFLRKARTVLKAGGMLFLTVPAMMRLWSKIDEASGHKRRYEIPELREKLAGTGFEVMYINYWSVTTLPMFLLYRKRLESEVRVGDLNGYLTPPPAMLNELFYRLLVWETKSLSRLKYPFGATLVVAARKE